MSPTEHAAARDRTLRLVSFTTGAVTVLALGATGATAGALLRPDPAPTAEHVPPPMPMRTVHVRTKAPRPAPVRAQAVPLPADSEPVATSGAS